MSPDFLLQLVIGIAGGIASAAGVYAAIKSDLTRAIITAERAQIDVDDAHDRMDKHLENHQVRAT